MPSPVEDHLISNGFDSSFTFRSELWGQLDSGTPFKATDEQNSRLLEALSHDANVLRLDLLQSTIRATDDVRLTAVGPANSATGVESELGGQSIPVSPDQTISLGQPQAGIFSLRVVNGSEVRREGLLFVRPVGPSNSHFAVELVDTTNRSVFDEAAVIGELLKMFFDTLAKQPERLLNAVRNVFDQQWLLENIVPTSTLAVTCSVGWFLGPGGGLACGTSFAGSATSLLAAAFEKAVVQMREDGIFDSDQADKLSATFNAINVGAQLGLAPSRHFLKKRAVCDWASLGLVAGEAIVARIDRETVGGEHWLLTLRMAVQEAQKYTTLVCITRH
jgi:hypothetical protein